MQMYVYTLGLSSHVLLSFSLILGSNKVNKVEIYAFMLTALVF